MSEYAKIMAKNRLKHYAEMYEALKQRKNFNNRELCFFFGHNTKLEIDGSKTYPYTVDGFDECVKKNKQHLEKNAVEAAERLKRRQAAAKNKKEEAARLEKKEKEGTITDNQKEWLKEFRKEKVARHEKKEKAGTLTENQKKWLSHHRKK